MKAAILFTASGPLAVLTRHDSLEDPDLLGRLSAKGIDKFLGYELPVDAVRAAYGTHFTMVMQDHRQTDELRILDEDGGRLFMVVAFDQLGDEVRHDPRTRQMPQDPAAMI